MKNEKEKIELEIQKLTDKRDNSSDTFSRIKLFNQIKKLKDKLEKL
jgi:predicted  nucleic acid-binding Zn-ribbon protein